MPHTSLRHIREAHGACELASGPTEVEDDGSALFSAVHIDGAHAPSEQVLYPEEEGVHGLALG
eukprot:9480890-Pyramimonas_sp.AAC.1